jgi:hypothetical protein
MLGGSRLREEQRAWKSQGQFGLAFQQLLDGG